MFFPLVKFPNFLPIVNHKRPNGEVRVEMTSSISNMASAKNSKRARGYGTVHEPFFSVFPSNTENYRQVPITTDSLFDFVTAGSREVELFIDC